MWQICWAGVKIQTAILMIRRFTILIKFKACESNTNESKQNIKVSFDFLNSNSFVLAHFNYGTKLWLTFNYEPYDPKWLRRSFDLKDSSRMRTASSRSSQNRGPATFFQSLKRIFWRKRVFDGTDKKEIHGRTFSNLIQKRWRVRYEHFNFAEKHFMKESCSKCIENNSLTSPIRLKIHKKFISLMNSFNANS